MKIIELLNKIANGEDVPDKIKYRNCIFEKTEGAGISPDYVNNNNEFFLEYISNEADSLNEIVEIIEDEKEIDIQSIEEIKEVFIENSSCGEDVKFLARKYNLILQAVKQLEKNIKELR